MWATRSAWSVPERSRLGSATASTAWCPLRGVRLEVRAGHRRRCAGRSRHRPPDTLGPQCVPAFIARRDGRGAAAGRHLSPPKVFGSTLPDGAGHFEAAMLTSVRASSAVAVSVEPGVILPARTSRSTSCAPWFADLTVPFRRSPRGGRRAAPRVASSTARVAPSKWRRHADRLHAMCMAVCFVHEEPADP